ncbi:MAG: type II secretion system protein N [Salinisphaeraceae bacterium]|nr:type II secretion system protein N [Salinisphaeraceae bacterium]
MNYRLLIPAGLLSMLVGLVLWLPASVAAGWIERAVPGLNLSGLGGSAINGRAALVTYQNAALEDVGWTLHPLALLTGRVKVSLQTGTDTGQLSADLVRSLGGQVRVSSVNGSASLATLAAHAGYRFLPTDGVLRLFDVSAEVEPAGDTARLNQVAGTVVLDDSHWLLVRPPIALGRFEAILETRDEKNRLRVVESDGPIAVEGMAELDPGNNYSLDMKLRPRSGADARLQKMLGQMGRPDASGWYPVRERGSLQ